MIMCFNDVNLSDFSACKCTKADILKVVDLANVIIFKLIKHRVLITLKRVGILRMF